MSAFVSMLKGINVGRQKQLRMETLRGIYEELGFTHVRSYVQSGNIVFESPQPDQLMLVNQIEAGIEQSCGYHVPVFIRRAHGLRQIIESNPFLNDKNKDTSKLHVTFLYQSAPESVWNKVVVPAGISDEYACGKDAIYLYCPNGYGKSRLSTGFFEKRLSMPVTTRNWNTVNALYEMVTGD